MKIMVVGSSGYIGRRVVKSLAEQRAEIVGFDLVPAPQEPTLYGVPFVQGDMVNLEEIVGPSPTTACNASSRSAIS